MMYCTREDVKSTLERNGTQRSNGFIDDKIDASSRGVEGCLHRRFYPEKVTVRIDYPNWTYSNTWKLWLGANELVSLDSLSSGGVTISPPDFFLRRSDDKDEAPYDSVELSLDGSASFGGGSTFQRDITLVGTVGYWDKEVFGAVLSANINDSVTIVDVQPLSNLIDVGVGSLIKMGTERLIVKEIQLIDSGQILQDDITANKGNTLVTVASANPFAYNDIILLDNERMRVDDIAGNTLIVERAVGGTVLSAHTGSSIYVPHRLIVQRGVLGTTAASHNQNDTINTFEYPGLVREASLAGAVVLLEQGAAAYARTVGQGENLRESSGRGLKQILDDAYATYGRKGRLAAI